MDLKQEFLIFLKGLAMGVADIIPGVSGGTIALITGIYERLVFGIRDIDFKFLLFAIKGDFKRAKENFLDIDLALFVPLLSGLGVSFTLFAGVIDFCLNVFPALTFAFFFGLILASARTVFAKIKNRDALTIGFIFLGLFLGVAITLLNPVKSNPSPLVIVGSGMVAICAMILPGISGAFLLLLLGQYEFIVRALHNFDFVALAIFNVGTISGIILFSRLLAFLLKKHESRVLGFLTGLMIGGLNMPLQRVGENMPRAGLLLPVIAALAGIVVVMLLEFFSGKHELLENH